MRNKLFSYVCVPAAALAALLAPSSLRAQIETFDTIASYNLGDAEAGTGPNNDSAQNFGVGAALTQTFQNVQELNDMTYQFIQYGNASNNSSTIQAYLVQWNAATNEATGSALFSQTLTIPPSNNSQGGWVSVPDTNGDGNTYQAYNAFLQPDTLLNPSDTYAMVLINTSSHASNIGLEDIYNEFPFTSNGQPTGGTSYGTAYKNTSGLVTNLSYLTTNSSSEAENNGAPQNAVWGFSQLDVIPVGNTLPEPRTAAVALCGLFVAILMGRHLYQNRKLLADATGATLA